MRSIGCEQQIIRSQRIADSDGNGFLAAFLAGLLANYNHGQGHFHTTLRTMEIKVESIAKPMISIDGTATQRLPFKSITRPAG